MSGGKATGVINGLVWRKGLASSDDWQGREIFFLSSLFVLSKPFIVAAVALCGFTGMVLAAGGLPEWRIGLVCMLGLLMSAAGSAMINGVIDSSIDGAMARLKKRVRALDKLGPKTVLFLSLILIAGSLGVFFSFVNMVSGLLAIGAIISYVLLYTLYLKRRSAYSSILGGTAGALPALIGYSAVDPGLGTDAVILFVIMMVWQPPHFWTLALEYEGEYRAAGVPVLPGVKSVRYTKTLTMIFTLALLPLSLSLWALDYASAFYGVMALVLGSLFITLSYVFIFKSDKYRRAFRVSIIYIVTLFLAVICDKIVW